MFEKPQYLTPNGYRRMPRRPGVKGSGSQASSPVNALINNAQKPIKKASFQRKTLSKEAAMLIANALKAMLHDK